MSRLRFGLVGCGAIVTMHQLPALKRCSALEVVGLVDRDLDWARSVAARAGVPGAFSDHMQLVGAVDAVLVATPNSSHAAIACDLLEQGIHVLCEKPLGITRAEVDRMLVAADRGGGRLMAAHSLRFNPSVSALKQAVDAGWLGELRHVAVSIGGPYEGVARRTEFRRQRALSGGGVLMDLGIHVLDLAVWLIGHAPVHVEYAGTAVEDGWEVETDAEVELLFPGDARASLQASFSSPMKNMVNVRGTKGWARASLHLTTETTVFAEDSRICRRAGLQTLRHQERDVYEVQIEHFCDAIATGGPFLVRDAEVCATIDVVDHCYGRIAA